MARERRPGYGSDEVHKRRITSGSGRTPGDDEFKTFEEIGDELITASRECRAIRMTAIFSGGLSP